MLRPRPSLYPVNTWDKTVSDLKDDEDVNADVDDTFMVNALNATQLFVDKGEQYISE